MKREIKLGLTLSEASALLHKLNDADALGGEEIKIRNRLDALIKNKDDRTDEALRVVTERLEKRRSVFVTLQTGARVRAVPEAVGYRVDNHMIKSIQAAAEKFVALVGWSAALEACGIKD